MISGLSFLLLGDLAHRIHAQSTQPSTTSGSQPTEACAQVSGIVGSSLSANPSATAVRLPPQLAHDCSLSVPIVKQDALDLVEGLQAWLQSQSTLAYLKDPPAGYLMNRVDILGGLDKIQQKVNTDSYSGELSFQLDIVNLVSSAHDGHFAFQPDMMNIFVYERSIGNLVSVSPDGESLPQIFSYNDLAQARNGSLGWEPSPIIMVDGRNAFEWLDYQALNTTANNQDPDANWNALFYEITNTVGNFALVADHYPGDSNNFTFANGTSRVFPIVGITTQDFTGVVDGISFYQNFCNATAKMMADATSAVASTTTNSNPRKTSNPADSPLLGYPEPVVADEDATLAGFFMRTPGLEDTAVLAVKGFEPTDDKSFIDTMKKFLDECRRTRKTNLIVDVSGNPGGNVLLAVDTFKQLFPTLEPYNTFSFRATPQLEILVDFYTSSTASLQGENEEDFSNAGGDSDYDISSLDNAAGEQYTDFGSFWNPFHVYNDSFTPLARYDYSNVEASEIEDGLVVSGYGDNREIGPQPFPSENIILLTDGQCASSCHTFSHLLKWQGKVKTIAVGGRPQTDGQPMQYVGGVKGSEVVQLGPVLAYVNQLYETAPEEYIQRANQTGLKTLQELGNYTLYRSIDPVSSSYASVNYQNFIAQHDSSYTPLQFVYEAADCRVWQSLEMVFDITAAWQRAAREAFAIGPNATEVFGGCIRGSTNAPSSLSGNETLFDNGEIANVTDFIPSTTAEDSGSGQGVATPSQSADSRASDPVQWSEVVVFAILAAGFSLFMLLI